MADEAKSIKIDKIEIKDHRTVSFTMALIIGLICFTAGALAIHFFYMVLPQKPGCIQVKVRTTDGISVKEASVAIIFNRTGEDVAFGLTDKNGRIVFCGYFLPNEDYTVLIFKDDLSGFANFRTNERSTASFPVIVRYRTS